MKASPGWQRLPREFFERDAARCARDLIGTEFRWGRTRGIVVETEAYAEIGDEACHTFFRPSARDFVENHPAGTAYVYLNYGVYWLTNVLVKDPATGDRGFVLLRALEPTGGLETMRHRRNRTRLEELCSGPGKLSMALGIRGEHHGVSLVDPRRPRGFYRDRREVDGEGEGRELPPGLICADRRVGISRSRELPWRFLLPDNPHVSVPFGRVRRKAGE